MNYSDVRLFVKYALRDFLRDRYRGKGDLLPSFDHKKPAPQYKYSHKAPAHDSMESTALARLNAAWNVSYATWDSAGKSIVDGTGGWPSSAIKAGLPVGFMDEDGSVAYSGSCLGW